MGGFLRFSQMSGKVEVNFGFQFGRQMSRGLTPYQAKYSAHDLTRRPGRLPFRLGSKQEVRQRGIEAETVVKNVVTMN